MPKTGRSGYISLSVSEYNPSRLSPPAGLTPRQRQIFVDLILSLPAEHFQQADVALVARWAEACAMAEEAATELARAGLITAEGKQSPWFGIHQQATKTLNTLALRLRLAPQSRQ